MNLITESLWGDEAFSALAVVKSFPDMVGIVMKDTAPPFFYIVGYLWVRVFGFSEVALRSLSLLLMLGSGVFAGLIVFHLDKNRTKAILTGGLAFFSPFLFRFAFEWRMYALLTFMVTASTYFFITKKWGWYIVTALAALYTHHFAVFTIFAQGLWFLITDFSWKKPGRWWTELRPFLLIGLGYSLWLYPMYVQIQKVRGGGFWLSAPKLSDLFDLLYRFLTGGVAKVWQLPVAAVGIVLLITKDWKRVWKDWLGLLVIFSAPIFLSFALSLVITPIFYDRYLLSAVAGVSVLLVLGTKKRLEWMAGILLLLYGFLSGTAFVMPTKRPFQEMAAYIKTQVQSDDFLLNWNGSAHHLWESKYYGVPAPIYTPGGPLPLYVGTAQMTPEDTINKLPNKSRIGLIASEDPKDISLPGYNFTYVKQFGELRFMWWNKIK